MRPASIWLFLALVLVPMLHAELLPWVRGSAQTALFGYGRRHGRIPAGMRPFRQLLRHRGRAIIAQLPLDRAGHSLHFAIDSLNGPLLPLLTLLSLALVVGGSPSTHPIVS